MIRILVDADACVSAWSLKIARMREQKGRGFVAPPSAWKPTVIPG